jgi:hypothetical protein
MQYDDSLGKMDMHAAQRPTFLETVKNIHIDSMQRLSTVKRICEFHFYLLLC